MVLRNMQGWKDSEPLQDQLDLVCEVYGEDRGEIKDRRGLQPKSQD